MTLNLNRLQSKVYPLVNDLNSVSYTENQINKKLECGTGCSITENEIFIKAVSVAGVLE